MTRANSLHLREAGRPIKVAVTRARGPAPTTTNRGSGARIRPSSPHASSPSIARGSCRATGCWARRSRPFWRTRSPAVSDRCSGMSWLIGTCISSPWWAGRNARAGGARRGARWRACTWLPPACGTEAVSGARFLLLATVASSWEAMARVADSVRRWWRGRACEAAVWAVCQIARSVQWWREATPGSARQSWFRARPPGSLTPRCLCPAHAVCRPSCRPLLRHSCASETTRTSLVRRAADLRGHVTRLRHPGGRYR